MKKITQMGTRISRKAQKQIKGGLEDVVCGKHKCSKDSDCPDLKVCFCFTDGKCARID